MADSKFSHLISCTLNLAPLVYKGVYKEKHGFAESDRIDLIQNVLIVKPVPAAVHTCCVTFELRLFGHKFTYCGSPVPGMRTLAAYGPTGKSAALNKSDNLL